MHGRPGAGHEVAQHAELALGQLDRRRAVAEVDAAAHRSSVSRAGAQMPLGLGRRRRAAPQVRADPRDELGELERLGDEVGRAELEAADLHVDVGRGREDEDALLGPAAHDLPEDHEPVDVAHAQVEHDQGVAAVEGGVEAALAAERDVDREALRAQRAPDEARDVRLVVDDEHAPRGHGGGGGRVCERGHDP